MSRIEFQKVRFKNIGSFGENWTEIDLSTRGTTMVTGKNGHGKSFAFLDTICFGLFGKAFRDINKPQLVNSVNEKELLVEIEFRIGTRDYKIVRGQKPTIFDIFEDGVLIDQESTVKEYQRLLEQQILKMNYKSFTQIVVMGSSIFVPFMQLTPADRRAVIEDLLDIQIFSKMNDILKNEIAALKEQHTKASYELGVVEASLEMHRKKQRELESTVSENIDWLKEHIRTAKDQHGTHREEINRLQGIVDDCAPSVARRTTLTASVDQIRSYRGKIVSNQETAAKTIDFFETQSACPTCDQEIPEVYRKEKIEKFQAKVDEATAILQQFDVEYKKVSDEIESLSEDVQRRLTALNEIQTLTSQLSLLQGQITDYQARIAKLEEDLEETESNDTSGLEQEKTQHEKEVEGIEDQQKVHDIAYKMLKDSGIKAKIIRKYLPVINTKINEYLQKFEFFVSFQLDEKFQETILSRHCDVFSYNSFSEGEKARIDIALLFTWRELAGMRNSSSCNLLIMDEIFDGSMDAIGTDCFMNLLREMGQTSSVFVISHKGSRIEDVFDRHVSVVKKNNFSYIESEV